MTHLDLQPSFGPYRTLAHALEPFIKAARTSTMLGVFLDAKRVANARHDCGAEFHARLTSYTRRSAAARKLLELPLAGANPTRVRDWLETSLAHLCPDFSPLKERGPPCA
jgi:hypothetical protein